MQQKELLELLETYVRNSGDEEDKERGVQVIELVRGTPEFWKRDNFDPGHVTASAFVINKKHDATLLVNHRKLQRWQQLGGHIEEDDENIFSAVLRELKEESGLSDVRFEKRIFDIDIHPIPQHKGEPEHKHFDIRILVFVCGSEEIIPEEDEPQEVKWISFNAIPSYTSETSINRMVKKFRAL